MTHAEIRPRGRKRETGKGSTPGLVGKRRGHKPGSAAPKLQRPEARSSLRASGGRVALSVPGFEPSDTDGGPCSVHNRKRNKVCYAKPLSCGRLLRQSQQTRTAPPPQISLGRSAPGTQISVPTVTSRQVLTNQPSKDAPLLPGHLSAPTLLRFSLDLILCVYFLPVLSGSLSSLD